MIAADVRTQREHLRHNVASYSARLEEGVRQLAKATRGGLAGDALERFRWVRERLGKPAPVLEETTEGDKLYAGVTQALPSLFQLVATVAEGKVQGFGYLTQGRPGSSLPESLLEIVEGVVRVEVESGGSPAAAKLFTELFRLSFPSLERLRDFSPMSLGLLAGVVPKAKGYAQKLYFNTRLGAATGHDVQLAAFLAHASGTPKSLVDKLYETAYVADTRFYGVGVDLGPTAPLRTKLYLHVPYAELGELEARLVAFYGDAHASAVKQQVGVFERWFAAFEREHCGDAVEIAFTLTPDGAPLLKATVFFAAKREAAESLGRYLLSQRLPMEPLRATMRALAQGTKEGVACVEPLFAAALEQPPGAAPRVNVYMQPVI